MGMYQRQKTWQSLVQTTDSAQATNQHIYTQIWKDYLTSFTAQYYTSNLKRHAELIEELPTKNPTDDDLSPLDLSRNASPTFSENIFAKSDSLNSCSQTFAECPSDVPLDLSIKSQSPEAVCMEQFKSTGEETRQLISTSNIETPQFPEPMEISVESVACCKPCNMSFPSELCYHRHKNLHKTKDYNCYMCGRSYKQARDYRAHVAAHENGCIFQCDICKCVLSTSSDYLQHLKTHKQKDLHFCSHCKKYFRDACTLETHIRIHTGLKPYKCEECGKEFRQSGTYRRHQKIHKSVSL